MRKPGNLEIEDLKVGSLVLREGVPYKLQRRDIGECKYVWDNAIELTTSMVDSLDLRSLACDRFTIAKLVGSSGFGLYHDGSWKGVEIFYLHQLQELYYVLTTKTLNVDAWIMSGQ